MVVLAAFDGHVVVLHGDHPGLALVGPCPSAGPIGFRSRGLVSGEGELSYLQLATPAKASDIRVIRDGICEWNVKK